MITYTSAQEAALAQLPHRITWLFETSGFKWSTKRYTYNAVAYEARVVADSFNGVTENAAKSAYGIQAPSDVSFTVTNKGNTLSTANFKTAGEWNSVTVRMLINAVQIRAWTFRITDVDDSHQRLRFTCEDYLQKKLEGTWPDTPSVTTLSDNRESLPEDNLCVPIPFGRVYIPVRFIVHDSVTYYLLGPADGVTYTIYGMKAPRAWPNGPSYWSANDYTFTQSTIVIGGVNYRVVRPLVANGDFVHFLDSSGIRLDPLLDFSRSDLASKTSFADVIEYLLESWGIPSAEINTGTGSSFETAATTHTSWGLAFNYGFHYPQDKQKILAAILTACNSTLRITDKIELHPHNRTSRKTLTTDDIRRQSKAGPSTFTPGGIKSETLNDAAYTAFSETGAPQDKLFKVVCTPDGSDVYSNLSDETFENPFVHNSVHAKRAGELWAQQLYWPEREYSFTASRSHLNLQPDDVITINSDRYGGTYTVVIESITIDRGGHPAFSVARLKQPLENWADNTPTAIDIVEDATTGAYQVVVCGPSTTVSSGKEPNSLPGALKVGAGVNYITIDPDTITIKLTESGAERLILGKLATDEYGWLVNDAAENEIMRISSTTYRLVGFSLDYTEGLFAGTGTTRVQMKAGAGFWAGATARDDAPFRVTPAGALTATTATITGTITATSGAIGGWTVNETDGLYSGSGAARVQMKAGAGIWAGAEAQASALFSVDTAGAMTAKSGSIGGWTIAAGKISITGLELDSTNNRFRAFTGSNYVDITAGGITGYDTVLGTTFKLPTNGDAPEFSSGIIKECVYEIYTSGIIRTDANPAANGGLLINNTELKGYNSSGLLLLKLVYDGTDQGDAYIGDYDSGNAGLKYDHSAGTFNYRGNLYIKSGGDIDISDGGDLIMRSVTGSSVGNRSIIKFPVGNSEEIWISADYDNRRLSIAPAADFTSNVTSFLVGYDYTAGAKRFYNIFALASYEIEMLAYNSDGDYAGITLDSDVTGVSQIQIQCNQTGANSADITLTSEDISGYDSIITCSSQKVLFYASNLTIQNTCRTALGGVKATTGDPSTPTDTELTINTYDNAIKIYADGAWRTIVTW